MHSSRSGTSGSSSSGSTTASTCQLPSPAGRARVPHPPSVPQPALMDRRQANIGAGTVESGMGGCPTVLPNRTPQPTEMPTTCHAHSLSACRTCSARVLRMTPCRPAPAAKSMAAAAPGQQGGGVFAGSTGAGAGTRQPGSRAAWTAWTNFTKSAFVPACGAPSHCLCHPC